MFLLHLYLCLYSVLSLYGYKFLLKWMVLFNYFSMFQDPMHLVSVLWFSKLSWLGYQAFQGLSFPTAVFECL